MNHSRQLAAAVACALTVGLFGGQALADGTPDPSEVVTPPILISPAPSPQPTPSTLTDMAESNTPLADAGERKSVIIESQAVSPDIRGESDTHDTISFENIESRIRDNNLTYQALEYSIEAMNDVDFDAAQDQLNMALAGLKAQQEMLNGISDSTDRVLEKLLPDDVDAMTLAGTLKQYTSIAKASISAQIATTQASLDDIVDGTTESSIAEAETQIRQGQEQIIMGGQTLYLSLLGLEQTHQSLNRQLAALDRTIAQLEVRYEMGQISALTMAETRAGRTALSSGIQTLEMNMRNLRRQLEGMLGEEITGTIQLCPIYAVTAQQLNAMNWDEDWKQLKRRSYALDNAQSAVTSSDSHYATHADNMTYKAALQTLELSFRALFDQIADQQQILSASKTTLAVKEDALAAAQLKYEQGTISRHALLDARDARDEAQDKADTAAIDLFTSYNNYCWAVDHGILN